MMDHPRSKVLSWHVPHPPGLQTGCWWLPVTVAAAAACLRPHDRHLDLSLDSWRLNAGSDIIARPSALLET